MSKDNKECGDIETCVCNTWEEFIQEVRKTRLLGERIFRGQRDTNWLLSSTWERWVRKLKKNHPGEDVTKMFSQPEGYGQYRDSYLDAFKHFVRRVPTAETREMSDKEWWALGRHHGLMTPLLDWTESLYIAAFFAFVDYIDLLNPGFKEGVSKGGITFGDGYVSVWELIRADEFKADDEFEIFTSYVGETERVRAQQSVFTYLSHRRYHDVSSYLKSRGLDKYLRKYEIRGQEMGKAIRDLELMGITFATLYPDLHGAAIQANLKDTFRIFGL